VTDKLNSESTSGLQHLFDCVLDSEMKLILKLYENTS